MLKKCMLNDFENPLLKNINSSMVVVCVGTNKVGFDSFGPRLGTILEKEGIFAKVYGTIEEPITALNIPYYFEKILSENQNKIILAIDACQCGPSQIGEIFFLKESLFPGSAFGKSLGSIGDYSLMAGTNFYRGFSRVCFSYEDIDNIVNKTVQYLKKIINNQTEIGEI